MTIAHTSALEREILTHYYVSPTQWKPGQLVWPKLVMDIHYMFTRAGLLRINVSTGEFEGNEEALRVYMDALSAIPLPVNVTHWEIPEEQT